MVELSSSGNPFTWGGMRGTSWIQCKLDRCFGNKEWHRSFPDSNQAFLDKRGSDHRPVLIKLFSSSEVYKGNFKFDKRLFNQPLVKEAINQAWNNAHGWRDNSVSERIKRCRRALSIWKKENNLNSRDRIIQIQIALEAEQSTNFPGAQKVFILKKELVKAYRDEELFWSQKSRAKWLKEGDKNTNGYP
ncbi:unnamed protein product [Microthlaspi erraticum]|uniref:Endonuclease/exonuclease/phosphatase domain-containing protein n=1 Tax=Microthlaspi erraticum TaxID=1685480 RepID=A0A6D2IKY4_9BRAS|nr:unnamed protein product [Microthlaspi erraticum]